MKTVDIVIGALFAVALLVTVLGVVFYEELTGEQDLVFVEETQDLEPASQEVDASPVEFLFELPTNATAADLEITITFEGQAIQGGSATVTIETIGPNDTGNSSTESFAIGTGQTSATETFTHSVRWMDLPNATRGDPETFEQTTIWGRNLTVLVSVEEPGEALPIADYSFEAEVTGVLHVYRHMTELPDVDLR